MTFLTDILKAIDNIDSVHGYKIVESISTMIDKDYREIADVVLNYFHSQNTSPETVAADYMHVVSDMKCEMLFFERHGKYRCVNQEEAFNTVYSRLDVMRYYMNGLIISHILWSHHFSMTKYYRISLQNLFSQSNKAIHVLDVGAGHGLYSLIAKNNIKNSIIDVVDISSESLKMTKAIIGSENILYNQANIIRFNPGRKYDLIILGEILEHLDKPEEMLLKAKDLLSDQGYIFLTVPTNAPAIDHVYLFTSGTEILNMIAATGLIITSAISCAAELNNQTKLIGVLCKKQ